MTWSPKDWFDWLITALDRYYRQIAVIVAALVLLLILTWLGYLPAELSGFIVVVGAVAAGDRRFGVDDGTRTVEFLFATNRKRVGSKPFPEFIHEIENKLSFGAIHLHVPEDHKVGRIELPTKLQLFTMRSSSQKLFRKRYFAIENVQTFDQDRFLAVAASSEANTALIFVHGYNTRFYEAVYRFAQILWDAKFRGLPILFSWPSRGGILNYDSDDKSALASRRHFGELLGLIQQVKAIDTLHVIAHSMGNTVMLESLERLALSNSTVRLSEVIMAAPDVDRRLYEECAPQAVKVARGVTLYASSRDRALWLSGFKARDTTAGGIKAGQPLLISGIDAIDVSEIGVQAFGLNHNTFATDRSLLEDIGVLIHEDRQSPHMRNARMKKMPEGVDPPKYWQFLGMKNWIRWHEFRSWLVQHFVANSSPLEQ